MALTRLYGSFAHRFAQMKMQPLTEPNALCSVLEKTGKQDCSAFFATSAVNDCRGLLILVPRLCLGMPDLEALPPLSWSNKLIVRAEPWKA